MFFRALLLTAGLVSPVLAQAQPGIAAGGKDAADQSPSQSIQALAVGIEHEHALAALELSKHLWEAGRRDDAVFFFYLGQLRYRAYLSANPTATRRADGPYSMPLCRRWVRPSINMRLATSRLWSPRSTASSPGTRGRESRAEKDAR